MEIRERQDFFFLVTRERQDLGVRFLLSPLQKGGLLNFLQWCGVITFRLCLDGIFGGEGRERKNL